MPLTSTHRLPIPRRWKRAIEDLLLSRPVAAIVRRLLRGRIRAYGATHALDTELVPARVDAAVLFRVWERAEVDFVRRHLPRHLPVVELGACTGVVSAVIAAQLGRGTLVTVEPDPRRARSVERAVASNGPGVRHLHVAAAVSYSGEPAFLAAPDAVENSHLAVAAAEAMPVRSVTLSEVLRDVGLDSTDFALVCDIEGGEAAMFSRDASALRRCQAAVIELHDTKFDGRDVTVASIEAALTSCGLHVEDRRGPVLFASRRPA